MKKYMRMVALQDAVREDINALTGDLRCLVSSKRVAPESATYYVIYSAIQRLTALHVKLCEEIYLQVKDNA